MIEEEAKTKWCPHVRHMVWPDEPSGGNQLNSNCIASGCMMWEPYEYYVDGKGSSWSQQNKDKTLTLVSGGDCGLKSKESEGCRL